MAAPDIDPGTSLRTKGVHERTAAKPGGQTTAQRPGTKSQPGQTTNTTEAQDQIKQYRRGRQHAHKHLKGKKNRSSRTQATREGGAIRELRRLNAPAQGRRIREEAAMSSPDG